MGAVAPTKNGRKAPITKVPSFVYRQDGCELSYEVEIIIAKRTKKVKNVPLIQGGAKSLVKEKHLVYQRKIWGIPAVISCENLRLAEPNAQQNAVANQIHPNKVYRQGPVDNPW